MLKSVLAATAVAVTLAGCAATPGPPPQRSLESQRELDRLLAGKVAGRPQACLPSFRADNMTVIDGNTILFRDGASRVWRANVRGGCEPLGRIGYALVTRSIGTSGLCSGDISNVVDTATGMFAGSCSFESFTPYTRP